ncbi:uncharacterized protein YodC (DUF2158 family) [Rhizobium sp. BK512]|uniref:DUF2158 domain-containing protein n=1 Tax=Rhizobium sp. BK512 TaxID=2587010 RepID=UPI00161C05B5|nr:DUF2158 domain-containing protein [Rhizobium sp. BK512]MBB3562884.1 uncharacterized protein YodC (DUF2158 family) [Rhizobium sp. BK512]
MAFKVGDIVMLKSGGPKMTVVSVVSSTTVQTSWFAGAKNEKAHFAVDALEVAKDANVK